MRNLYQYARRVMEMMDKISIPYNRPYEWKVNTRALRRWGCTHKKEFGYWIDINQILLDESVPESELISTIAHELCHTCDGCMNHGNLWKIYANKFQNAYGYKIARTSNCGETAHAMLEEKQHSNAYVLECERCGTKIYRQRASDVTRYPERFRHGKCGGKLKLIRAKNGYQILRAW